jgi:hypothetical protein
LIGSKTLFPQAALPARDRFMFYTYIVERYLLALNYSVSPEFSLAPVEALS